MKGTDLTALMKRVVELVTPNLRGYYRMPVKGRIVKTYPSDGDYRADVQPTRNDESDDAGQPVIPKVEIPVIWGGPERGVVCPIPEGTRVIVSFFDGDPNYPFISQVRWHGNKAPACEVNGFIIQMAPGCHIKIDAGKNILVKTPTDVRADVGENMLIEIVGDAAVTVGGNASLSVGENVVIEAGGDMAAAVQGNLESVVEGSVSVEAGDDVTVSVEKNAVVAAGGNVAVSGAMIDLN